MSYRTHQATDYDLVIQQANRIPIGIAGPGAPDANPFADVPVEQNEPIPLDLQRILISMTEIKRWCLKCCTNYKGSENFGWPCSQKVPGTDCFRYNSKGSWYCPAIWIRSDHSDAGDPFTWSSNEDFVVDQTFQKHVAQFLKEDGLVTFDKTKSILPMTPEEFKKFTSEASHKAIGYRRYDFRAYEQAMAFLESGLSNIYIFLADGPMRAVYDTNGQADWHLTYKIKDKAKTEEQLRTERRIDLLYGFNGPVRGSASRMWTRSNPY